MYRGEEARAADLWAMEICRFRYVRAADPKTGSLLRARGLEQVAENRRRAIILSPESLVGDWIQGRLGVHYRSGANGKRKFWLG